MTILPTIGITMGDPASIASEITAKMFAIEHISNRCIPVFVGDARVLRQGYAVINAEPDFEVITGFNPPLTPGRTYVYDTAHIEPAEYAFGQVSAAAGRAAGESIAAAVKLALDKEIDAVVTNPIHKESFNLGGWGKKYPGHTEMLAALTNTQQYCMMLSTGTLRICHVTTHVSLLDALTRYITTERILDVIKLAHKVGQQLGVSEPVIGVAGINPHAGEHGLFGDEETRIIQPALDQAMALGIKVDGPVPPDTLFSKARGGWYTVAVAMYHDQGHIASKVTGFIYDSASGQWSMTGVNVTLGLPIIRTSVDHGTAFDRAGHGNSDHKSLVEATDLAIALAGGGR
jgi:4-phospho-D-threonate 3-dehydrogenase / 4-phospho-D-erythronate 3-dehydrogenase